MPDDRLAAQMDLNSGVLRMVGPRPFLGRLRAALLCALLAAGVGLAVEATLLVHDATVAARALPVAVSSQVQAARKDLVGQIQAARGDLTGQVAAVRVDLFRQVGALRVDTTKLANRVVDTTDRRVGDSLARVDAALAKVEELRGDLKPTLDNTAAITAQAKDASEVLLRRDALPAQLLGLTAAAKVTLGQAAETMRDFQRATPGFIATWQQIGQHIDLLSAESAKASQATAKTMEHLAKATNPLPSYIRIPLSVAGAIAPPIAGALEAAAATGAFAK